MRSTKAFLVLLALCLLLAPAEPRANRAWLSGFELNSATAGIEWTAIVGSPAVNNTQVHAGSFSAEVSTAGAATEYFELTTATMGVGNIWTFRTYIYITDAPDTDTWILGGCDTGSVNAGFGVRLNTDRTLNLVSDCPTPSVRGSTSSAVPLNEWHYIELQGDWDTDACDARLDGASFAAAPTCTGDIALNRFRVGVGINGTTVANTTVYFDDVAWNNDDGSAQTSWPGAGYIVHLRPNADGDADVATTSAAGCTNSEARWDCIDEVTPDDATTQFYMTGTTSLVDVGIDDPTVPDSNDTVTLVGVGARIRTFNTCSATTGAGNYRNRIKSQASGTTATGSLLTVNSSTFLTNGPAPAIYNLVQYTDPQAGGAWTAALLTTSQIGIATTDGNPDTCVTTLWAAVEYVPVAPPAGGGCHRMLLGVGC